MSTEKWRSDNTEKIKAYRRQYYLANRQKEIEYQKAKNREKRAANVQMVLEAKAKPCADCGIQYPPHVMQFDHLGDKVDAISNMAWRGTTRSRILAEIDKCEIVCANCHCERTHRRRA